MEKKAKVPRLRFPGFAGEWEERKLTDEVELYSGLTYSPKDVMDRQGTLVLRSSNVKSGEIVDADNVYVKFDAVNSEKVQKGDIIIVVRNGSRSLIGKHAQVKVEMKDTVIGAFMTGIRSVNFSFINALLSTPAFDNEIRKNLGATINQITNGMFQQMLFLFPDEFEQKRMGEFFGQIDNLITLHQRKLTHLQAKKKSLLQKMFPKKGERVPEIRFPGFTDAWEQRKLGDIAEKITVGIATSSSQFFVGKGQGVFLIKNQNIKISGIDLENLEEISCEFDKANINKRLKANDIITVRTGYPGLSAVVPSFLEGAQTFTTLITRLSKNIALPEFVVLFINSDRGMMQISGMQAGGAQKNVNASILENLVVIMPDKDEQKKITNFFNALDNLITLHQRKLTHLQTQKKALLQQMFV